MVIVNQLAPGRRLGRYELVCPFGQGGMATVWLARLVGSRGFHKPVAIKILLPSIREDPDAERMFQNEAALASRIRHPNVVEILDFGEENGLLYIVMEWVHGESLSQIINAEAKRGGMPLGLALRMITQVCAGLHAAHELTDQTGKALGVVHRDVSPQNVLVGFNGVVTLVDFGIAKVTAEASHLTQGGMIKGKVSYMAPEQIRLEALDRRTDVFAAGILLYVLTTGRHPFKADEVSKTAIAITSGAPAIKPSKLVPGYPERLERVVLKALAKAPEDRYATAQELGDDLLRTMPPSRVAPHEELQKYMSELLPERLAEHQALIRKALGVWDPLGPQASTLPKTAHSSSTLRAVSVSDATRNAPLVEISGSPDAPENTPTGAPEARRPRSRSATALLAITAGATIGAVAIVATLGSRPGAVESQESHATAAFSLAAAPHPSTSPPPPVEAPPPVAPQAAEPAPSAQPNALEPTTKKSVRSSGAKPTKAKPAPSAATRLKNPYAQ